MAREILLEASSDEPGGSVTFTWMLPSSKGKEILAQVDQLHCGDDDSDPGYIKSVPEWPY